MQLQITEGRALFPFCTGFRDAIIRSQKRIVLDAFIEVI